MNNYKLKVTYDGTRYKGWQRLGNTDNTIQGKIEAVLTKLFNEEIQITGASRTDGGVHALNQVANFKVKSKLSPKEIKDYLNHYLPEDISIHEVTIAGNQFHSRFKAGPKTYVYKIWNRDYRDVFLRKTSLHIAEELDINLMKEVADIFIGEHDFSAFTSAKSKTKSMIRNIFSISIGKNQGMIEITFRGNGFLHNMVRRLVGAIIEVGLKKATIDDVKKALENKKSGIVGATAPALGLFLKNIEY